MALGLLSKLVGADKMDAVRNRVLSDIEAQLGGGRPSAKVHVSQDELGSRLRLDTYSNWLISRVEEAGYHVTDFDLQPWVYRAFLTVERRR